jgi:hypothetical protein
MPDSPFTGNVDTRFIGEGHPRLQFAGVAAHDVGRLVSFQSDPVPEAVSEILERTY